MFETEASRERWTARAALGALGVAALSALFTGLQWRAADRTVSVADQARRDANEVARVQREDSQQALVQQRKDAAEALAVQTKRADQAIALADRSAKAAETSASVASQALHVSERAYLYLTISLVKPPTAGERMKVLVVLGNSGRTPALDVTVMSRAVYAPPPISTKKAREMAFADPPQTEVSLSVLPAGQTKDCPSESPSPLVQLGVDELATGTAKIYVWASASYKDVFKQPHHTEACVTYSPIIKGLADCAEGNKSD
jgi:hypothetical protein